MARLRYDGLILMTGRRRHKFYTAPLSASPQRLTAGCRLFFSLTSWQPHARYGLLPGRRNIRGAAFSGVL